MYFKLKTSRIFSFFDLFISMHSLCSCPIILFNVLFFISGFIMHFFDSGKYHLMINIAYNEIIKAATIGNSSPYLVAPSIPARAGPTINPRFADTAILPKFFLRFFFVVISAMYALATDILPPVIPSSARATRRITKGIETKKIPKCYGMPIF